MGRDGWNGGQGERGVAAVAINVQSGQAFQQRAMRPVEEAERDKMIGQWPLFVASPRLERPDELDLVDQSVLEREQSEEEMAVGGGGHGMSPIIGGRSGESPGIGGRPGS